MNPKEYYLVLYKDKYMHLDPVNGFTWGKKRGAFKFNTLGEATRIGGTLTPRGTNIRVLCMKED